MAPDETSSTGPVPAAGNADSQQWAIQRRLEDALALLQEMEKRDPENAAIGERITLDFARAGRFGPGIALSAVRRLIEDRELLSARIGERRVVAVPEQFLHEDVFRHLRGTFTVLGDGGLDDDEILRWLFTPDPTLRVPGTPVDNLAAGFKTEVRRRAMEQAF